MKKQFNQSDIDRAINRFCDFNKQNPNLDGIASLEVLVSSEILKDLYVFLEELLKDNNKIGVTHIRLCCNEDYLNDQLIYIDDSVYKIIDMRHQALYAIWVEALENCNIPVYAISGGLEFKLDAFIEFLLLHKQITFF